MDKSIPCYLYSNALYGFYDAVIIDNTIYSFEDGIKKPPRDVLFDPEDQLEVFVIGHPDHPCFYDIEPQDRIPARWGYYDINTGEILLPPAYDEVFYFRGDFALVKSGGKYGVINREGCLVVDYTWDEIKCFNSGLCPVRRGKKWGYINESGKLIIELMFDEADTFTQLGKYSINAGQYENKSIARVRLGDKYGYINLTGEYIVEPSLEDALEFWDIGYAGIKCSGKWGLIDNNGMLVVGPQFDQIGPHYRILETGNKKQGNKSNHICFIVQTNGQWGIMDEDYHVVMPEPNQRYVVLHGSKIYIDNGRVTSTRKIKPKDK